jgi:hypothetical protein
LALFAGLLLGVCFRVSAQTNLPVYTDRLLSGFEDWGWAPHSYTNTSPVYAGSYSLSVTAAAWNGVLLHRPELNTGGFTNLSFWVHGGEHGGQLIRISAKLGTNDSPGYEPPPLPAGKWQQFVLPLELIGAERKSNFQGIMFLLRGDGPETPFFLDEIVLEAVPAPPQLIIREAQPPPPAAAPTNAAPNKSAADKAAQGKTGVGLEIWVAGALTLIAVFLAWLVFVIRKTTSPAKIPAGPVNPLLPTGLNGVGRVGNGGNDDWRQRALAAEAVASKQAQILRENLVPELTELAKSSLVQGLASQRNSLLDTQRQAQQDLAALESRLAELQLPLRDRISVYEKRIAELEKELATRGEEMRELIRATLVLVRQRLDEERKKETVTNGAK